MANGCGSSVAFRARSADTAQSANTCLKSLVVLTASPSRAFNTATPGAGIIWNDLRLIVLEIAQ
jgi:hypothetical protein